MREVIHGDLKSANPLYFINHTSKQLMTHIKEAETISYMYAHVSVSMKTLPINMSPSEYELHEALLAVLQERLDDLASVGNRIENLEKIRFEYEKVGTFDWVKTSLTYRGNTYEFWQTVDYRNNHYTIMFETDDISRVKPIFANIIKSFSLVK